MSAVPGQIEPAEVKRWLDAGRDFVLLDCRDPEEVRFAAVPGALNIPMGDIPGRLPQLDPEKETVVLCHRGVRSQSVAQFLAEQDFDRVHSMRGGIDAWSLEIDPAVPRY